MKGLRRPTNGDLWESEILRVAVVFFAIAAALGLLLVLCLSGCAEPPTAVYGYGARAAAPVALMTPAGLVVVAPGWFVARPDAGAALAEIDAGVAAFRAAWGAPVALTAIRIWPGGWDVIPFDGAPSGLAAGVYDRGIIILAWRPERPHFLALGHELAHSAGVGHESMEVAQAAIDAALTAQAESR